MYIKEFLIETSDVDAFKELKLSSLFRMMQDAATEHAEQGGIGQSVVSKNSAFWVITRYSVNIIKMPKYMETIRVCTYAGKDMKFIYPRYFQIEDLNGNVLIKASSTWVVLHSDTHKIHLNPFNGKLLPEECCEGEEALPKKVTPPEMRLVERRKVRYSDVDLNQHLNNTKYIEYIQDVHEMSFYETNKIKHIVINYNKEVRCDEVIDLKLANGDIEYISGEVNGNNIFDVEIEYQRKS